MKCKPISFSSLDRVAMRVITLAPPLFPFPFDAILMRTLCRPLPKSVPMSGFCMSSAAKIVKSCFNDLYRLEKGKEEEQE